MRDKSTPLSWVAATALGVGCLAVLILACAVLGYRTGFLELLEIVGFLRWAAYAGIAGSAIALIGLIRTRPGARHRGLIAAMLGLALSAASLWVPLSMQRRAEQVPPIHDITTDTVTPPTFDKLIPQRSGTANGHVYAGDVIVKQQLAAYPDLRTLTLTETPQEVFDAALYSAQQLGWHIVHAAANEGRIEATDTTRWFGFKDDVVVRIQTNDGATLVDLRSASRVGVSDLGKNAERVRAFLATLQSRLGRD